MWKIKFSCAYYAVVLCCFVFGQTYGADIDFPLVTEFSQQTCIDKSKSVDYLTSYYYRTNEVTKLPYCDTLPTKKLISCKTDPCAPIFSCEKRCNSVNLLDTPCSVNGDCPGLTTCAPLCVPSPGDVCMGYHVNVSTFATTTFTAQMFKPQCLNDGSWAPKQCKGGQTGRCFCYDAVGTRIFGEALFTKSDDMTCACSRRKADLIMAGSKEEVFLHCDSKGNYEKLQCESGLCWCAEPKTGQVTASVVPEKAMKYLPCYSVASTGGQYFRKCDSEKQAQELIKRELKTHGVEYTNFRYLVCDGDGAYGPYNITEARPYCTWRDGSKIGSYMGSSLADLSFIRCNCARDLVKYGGTPSCTQQGNYEPVQTIENTGQTYCADLDGFRKSEYFSEIVDKDKCATYY